MAVHRSHSRGGEHVSTQEQEWGQGVHVGARVGAGECAGARVGSRGVWGP